MVMSNGDVSREGDDYIINRDREPSLNSGKVTLHVQDKSEGRMRVVVKMEKEAIDYERNSPTYMESRVEVVTLFDGELYKGDEGVKQVLLDATRLWMDL